MPSRESTSNPEDLNYEDEINSRLAEDRQKRMKQRLQAGVSVVKGDSAQQLALKAAQSAKRMQMLLAFIEGFIAILPWLGLALLILLIVLLGYWCANEPVDCIGSLGFGTVFQVVIDAVK